MIWLGIVIGLILGAGGYYLYDRYAGTVVSRLQKLESRAEALKAKVLAKGQEIKRVF